MFSRGFKILKETGRENCPNVSNSFHYLVISVVVCLKLTNIWKRLINREKSHDKLLSSMNYPTSYIYRACTMWPYWRPVIDQWPLYNNYMQWNTQFDWSIAVQDQAYPARGIKMPSRDFRGILKMSLFHCSYFIKQLPNGFPCCSTFGKRKIHSPTARVFSRFPKVSQHPSCMDHAILHGKHSVFL
jgi:hypothetical protein